jgi:hypothetical protein
VKKVWVSNNFFSKTSFKVIQFLGSYNALVTFSHGLNTGITLSGSYPIPFDYKPYSTYYPNYPAYRPQVIITKKTTTTPRPVTTTEFPSQTNEKNQTIPEKEQYGVVPNTQTEKRINTKFSSNVTPHHEETKPKDVELSVKISSQNIENPVFVFFVLNGTEQLENILKKPLTGS